jgi:hypothetical protein
MREGCTAPRRLSQRDYGLERITGAPWVLRVRETRTSAVGRRVDLNLLRGGGLAAQRLRALDTPGFGKSRDNGARRRESGVMACIVSPHIMRSEPFRAPCRALVKRLHE